MSSETYMMYTKPQHDVYTLNLNIKAALIHKRWSNENITWQPHPYIKHHTMSRDPDLLLA